MNTTRDILEFWLNAGKGKWFARDPAFDREIRECFETTHVSASRGELVDWGAQADGALALVILTDQFPRNLYRGSAHAFATDPMARETARAAIASGHDRSVDARMRFFFFMPFEHSEAIEDQHRAVALFEALQAETGEPGNLKWARQHRDIIARFGRFPHRNACMGRTTTPEEAKFLAEGGFAG